VARGAPARPVSYTDEQQARGAEYNFRWADDPYRLLDRALKGRDEDADAG
jgi:hypothetical protein